MLEKWAPVDVDDALELLSNQFAGAPTEVRRYAVSRLEDAADEDLQLYLLQLVRGAPHVLSALPNRSKLSESCEQGPTRALLFQSQATGIRTLLRVGRTDS